VIEAVAGTRPTSLAELFRSVWAQGPAGTRIAVALRRDGKHHDLEIESIDRESILWRPQGMN
jgi:S1-C subfamily serine protease